MATQDEQRGTGNGLAGTGRASRLCRALLLAFLASVPPTTAAEVCTWRGPSGGTWSTAANWDTSPVAGRGDVLVFSNPTSGTPLHTYNDLADLRLSGVRFLGSNPISVSGEPLVFGTGSCSFTNACTVVNSATLVANGSLRIAATAPLRLEGPITVSGTGNLSFSGKAKVEVSGAVTGDEATLVNDHLAVSALVDFRAPVRVAAVKSSTGYGELRFSATGNSWRTFSINPLGQFGAGVENAFPRDMVLTFRDVYRENRTDISCLRLNGWDQTIDRISSSTNAYAGARWESDHVRSDFAATLTLRGTADATTWCKVWDQLTLCWNPVGDFTQTFMDRDHATRGRIIVSNGTFRVGGCATFRNVREIEVAPGARFVLDGASTNALASLHRVVVGAGGTFDVSSFATPPFSAGEVQFEAAPDALLHLPAGYTTNYIAETQLLHTDFGTASRRSAVTNTTLGSSFTGVLPRDWGENFTGFSPAVCTSELLEEDGVRFLRFHHTGNTVQFRSSLGLLETPATYRVTATVRCRSGCSLGLRQDPSPYTTYASFRYKSFDWTTVTNYCTVETPLTTTTGLYLYPGIGATDVREIRFCRIPSADIPVERPAIDPDRVEFWSQRRFPFDAPAGWNFKGPPSAALAADPVNATPDGLPSLRLSATGSTTFHAPPMQTSQPGRAHTLAFRYRASGSWRIMVRAVDNATTLISDRTLPLSDSWRTATFTLGPREEDEGFYVTFTGSGVLNLDAPSCRCGRADSVPETGPEAVLACGPGDAAAARIQFTDEPAVGRWAAVDAPAGATLKLRETDLYGHETALADVPLVGGKLQTGTFAYAANPARPFGQFRIEGWIESGGTRLSPLGETILTRLPRPVHWGEDGTNSPFGTHLTAQVDQLVAAKAAGVNWTRFHDAGTEYSGWYHLEPTKGTWTWPDEAIDLIRAWHIKPFAQLGTAPTWATRFGELEKDPGSYFRRYLRPTNTVDWVNYVTTYVTRYRGKVEDFFIWNEPWGGWWKSADDAGLYDPDTCESDFAALCRSAYLAAKAANPSACVSGYNTTHGNTSWGLKLTQAGAFDFCDAIDYHFYTSTTRATTADEVSASQSCLAPIRAAHPDLGGKPVIMSEGQGNSGGSRGVGHRLSGLYKNLIPYLPESEDNYRGVADNTARYLVSLLAQGDTRLFLYSMHSHNGLGWSSSFATLVGEDGFPHPILVAHAAVARRLEGAMFLGRAAFGEYGALFAFRGADGTVTTYLSGLSADDARALAARTDVSVADLFGNPFTYETWHPEELVSVTGTRIEAPRESSLVYAWTGASGTGDWDDGRNWLVNAGDGTDHGPIPGAAIRFDSSAEVSSGAVVLGEGSTITVAANATTTLRVPLTGTGAVTKDGAGTLSLAGSGASFTGTLNVTGGVVRLSGAEPLGPCTVNARAVAPVGRLQLAGADTAANVVLMDGWNGSERKSLIIADRTANVIRGRVTGTTCTKFDVPTTSRLTLAGGCTLNYGNMGVSGTLVFTNQPFRCGTMEGSWPGRVEFWTAGNRMTALNGWHASWSPYPMTANIDFHAERALDNPSMPCSFDGIWNLHGTSQRIGSLNSTKASTRIRSFGGPARLSVNQTGKWKNFASKGSPTGLEDFAFFGAFEGEVSLEMGGSSTLVLAGVSTATGMVEVAGGTLVFTNGASWRTATDILVNGSGRIRALDANAIGPDAALRLDDTATLDCPAGITVRELRLNGTLRPAGVYGSVENMSVPAPNRTARLTGPGLLRVTTGPSTLLLIR